jgi:beta-D-galactosyl-(1->4)-L-rhamnose phosphorylase
LVEGYPDFCDYIEELTKEFRLIKSFHENGEVYTLPCKVAVLHSWGKLRSWTLSGHFHESYMNDLIHVNEALAGLPVDVKFISFEDVKNGALKDVDIVINAGRAGTAWSGGDAWKDAELVAILQKWVYEGGSFIGINEPSAVEGFDSYFRMAQVLGIDEDTGAHVYHGKWQYEIDNNLSGKLICKDAHVKGSKWLYLTDGNAKVISDENGVPTATVNEYGKGKGIYLGNFELDNANTRLLLNLITYAANLGENVKYITDNADAECAYYPKDNKLVVINNSEEKVETSVLTDEGVKKFTLEPFETKIF